MCLKPEQFQIKQIWGPAQLYQANEPIQGLQ